MELDKNGIAVGSTKEDYLARNNHDKKIDTQGNDYK